MNPISARRDFLQSAGFFTLGALGISGVDLMAETLPVKRTGGSHLKTSLNAYSFLELLNANAKDSSQGVDLFQICDFCATHDFDAVDLTGYFFPGYPNAPDDNYIIRLKRHAFNLGLGISGTGVRNDFTNADKTVRERILMPTLR